MTDIVDNEMAMEEAVKLSTPIPQNIKDDKWGNKLRDDRGNINGNKVRTYTSTLEAEN